MVDRADNAACSIDAHFANYLREYCLCFAIL